MSIAIASKKIASKAFISTAIVGFGLIAASSGAQAYGESWIDHVQAREAASIERGRYSGELTRREYRDLRAEQDSIRLMESRAKADGHVSRREYRNIAEAQRNAARHIRHETHDGQKSFWRRWLYTHRY